MRLFVSVAVAVVASACTKQATDNASPRDAAARRNAGLVAVLASSEPTTSTTSAAPSAPHSEDAPQSDAGARPELPIKVRLVTIGMHVGGGPYDEVTKEPMKRSVEPHFDELAKCWRHVPKPAKADVGVDLVIEAAGGTARVSNPRSTIEGEGFKPCVVAFFERIEFAPPKNGKSTVSYSVRFIP